MDTNKQTIILILAIVFCSALLGGGLYDLKTVSRGDDQPWVYRLNKWTGTVKIIYPGFGGWMTIPNAN
jgi:hypothetical protein